MGRPRRGGDDPRPARVGRARWRRRTAPRPRDGVARSSSSASSSARWRPRQRCRERAGRPARGDASGSSSATARRPGRRSERTAARARHAGLRRARHRRAPPRHARGLARGARAPRGARRAASRDWWESSARAVEHARRARAHRGGPRRAASGPRRSTRGAVERSRAAAQPRPRAAATGRRAGRRCTATRPGPSSPRRRTQAAGTALALAERSRARGLLVAPWPAAPRSPESGGRAPRRSASGANLTARIEMLTWLAAGGANDQGTAARRRRGRRSRRSSRGCERRTRAGWTRSTRPPRPSTPSRSARRCPRGSLLIEHLLVRGALLSWAITRDGVRGCLRRRDEVALDELQRKLWIACQGQSDRWERFARRLGIALLAPVRRRDRRRATTSCSCRTAGGSRRRCRPCLARRPADRGEVRLGAAVRQRAALPRPPRGSRRAAALLAVGDPTNMSRRRPGRGGGDRRIRRAAVVGRAGRRGRRAVRRRAGAARAGRRASGPCASGSAGARLVHFATHGELDEAPLLSCIVLADGDTLDVWELLGPGARRRPRHLQRLRQRRVAGRRRPTSSSGSAG